MPASAIVEVSCPFCGPVELPAAAVSVGVDPDGSSRGLCEFTCPFCSRPGVLATDRMAADALLEEGARPFAGPAPFELLEVHEGAPITYDDVLEFHSAIAPAPFPQAEVAPSWERTEVVPPGEQDEVVRTGSEAVVSGEDASTKGRGTRRLRPRGRHGRTER